MISLTDNIVTIREFRRNDVKALYVAARESIWHNFKFLPWCHPDYSLKDSKSWVSLTRRNFRKGIEYGFVIVDAMTDELLGGLSINRLDEEYKIGNMGYWVRARYLDQGIATRATKLAAKFAFTTLGLFRLELVIEPENIASQKVAEKLGACREGLCRNRIYTHSHPKDAYIYGLIPSDITLE